MTNRQLLFAIVGIITAKTAVMISLLKLFFDAEIDPLKAQVNLLIQYMTAREGTVAK